jgi:hypothetical protein
VAEEKKKLIYFSIFLRVMFTVREMAAATTARVGVPLAGRRLSLRTEDHPVHPGSP